MATTKKETALVATNGSLDLTGKGKDLYNRLSEFVKEALIENEHYGKIKGTNKPSLFKGGAELLAREADLVPTFEIIHQEIDFDRPLFAFLIKCTLHRDGEKISEATGACSNLERKFISPNIDKYFLFNNVPKMAEKRAYVSAVVRAWGLSGIFTQDMEDLEASPIENPQPPEPPEINGKFAKFRSAYFAQDKIKEMNEAERHTWNLQYIGKQNSKEFSEYDWKKAIELARLQSNPMDFSEKNQTPYSYLAEKASVSLDLVGKFFDNALISDPDLDVQAELAKIIGNNGKEKLLIAKIKEFEDIPF
jgi:hypothetical protein